MFPCKGTFFLGPDDTFLHDSYDSHALSHNIQNSDSMISDLFHACSYIKGGGGGVFIRQYLSSGTDTSNTLKHLAGPRDDIAIHKSLTVTSRVAPSSKQLMNNATCSCVHA